MSEARLLHAVRLTLHTKEQIAAALRAAYLARERGDCPGKTLFFCDLADADAKVLPADAELIRFVQSSVMRMAAQRPGKYEFLVRARRRDDVLHSFPGESQRPGARETLFSLLAGERLPAFAASSLSPAAFKNAFDAVLLTDASLSFPPDAPRLMLDALLSSGLPALRGGVAIPPRDDEPLLARLERAGFSLLPEVPFMSSAWEGAPDPPAAIYTPKALLSPPPEEAPDRPPLFLIPAGTLSDHVKAARLSLIRGPVWRALIPIVQAALLFFCSLAGYVPLALAAILAPELTYVRSLRQIPCALVRLALLPQSALLALNGLLARAFRGKKLLPSLSFGGGACAAFGGTLLFFSLRGANALPLLLLVGLLWVAAPLIARSLSLPTQACKKARSARPRFRPSLHIMNLPHTRAN